MLVSISQLGIALVNTIRGVRQTFSDASAMEIGIATTIVLQIIFSQYLMNNLFSTASLSLNQWLVCFFIGLPMIGVSIIVNRLDPLNLFTLLTQSPVPNLLVHSQVLPISKTQY